MTPTNTPVNPTPVNLTLPGMYPVGTWVGWVGEYMTDMGTDLGSDTNRVTDVGVYLAALTGDYPNGFDLLGCLTTLEGYLVDAPNVEDLNVYGAPGVCTQTVNDLMGYLSLRYENQLGCDLFG